MDTLNAPETVNEALYTGAFKIRTVRFVRIYWITSLAVTALIALKFKGFQASIIFLVGTAALYAAFAILLSTIVTRRCHASQLVFWRGHLVGLKLFYLWGLSLMFIDAGNWIMKNRPTWGHFWYVARIASIIYVLVMLCIWLARIINSSRQDTGYWKTFIIAVDLYMVAVIVTIPGSLVIGPSIFPFWRSIMGYGKVATLVVGFLCLFSWFIGYLEFLRSKSGARNLGIDIITVLIVATTIAYPIITPSYNHLFHNAEIYWLFYPVLGMAVFIPGAIQAAVMAALRVETGKRSVLIGLIIQLSSAVICAWYVVFDLTAQFTYPVAVLVLLIGTTSGLYMVIPTLETTTVSFGLSRLQPIEQVRNRTPITFCIGLGILITGAESFTLFDITFYAQRIFLSELLILLILLTGDHLISLREASFLYQKLELTNIELYNLARTDSLTGLSNRRSLKESLDHLIEVTIRSNEDLAIVLIDLDYFKQYNDTYGHIKGDEYLKHFAKLISINTRAQDLAARYGGEEFALVLPATEIKGAIHLTNKLRKDAAERSDDQITFSAGVTIYNRQGETIDTLLERVDSALYIAKDTGRNKTVFLESTWQLTTT